jgi:hypothetical protein
MRATFLAYLILPVLISLIIFGDAYKFHLLVMQSSPTSSHFLPLRSKYPPQHPVLKHVQSVRDKISHKYRTTVKITGFSFILLLIFLEGGWEDKRF